MIVFICIQLSLMEKFFIIVVVIDINKIKQGNENIMPVVNLNKRVEIKEHPNNGDEKMGKLVWICGHCGTEHKNKIEAKECCGGFEEQWEKCANGTFAYPHPETIYK